MTYVIRENATRIVKWGTDYPSCLPPKQTLQQLYSAGYSLYHKGQRLSLTAAIKHQKEVCQ